MDSRHIFQPETLITHLHESAHLLFSSLDNHGQIEVSPGKSEPGFKAMSQRLDEVFAWLIPHLLIFRDD